MNNLPIVLSAARALLQMNVKDVAAALKMSDKTITQLEGDADIADPKVTRLLQFYEDLGIEFSRDEKGPVGVSIASGQVRKLVFTFAGDAEPNARLRKLHHLLRNIAGMVSHTSIRDKSKASLEDTVEVHFPIETRQLVGSLLASWIEREGPFGQVVGKNDVLEVTAENVKSVVMGS